MGKYDIETTEKSAFAKTVERSEAVQNAVVTKAKGHIDIILLTAVCVWEIILNFVVLSFGRALDWRDILFTISETFTTVVVFYIFIPRGKNGRMALPSFSDAVTAWHEVCESLRKQFLLTPFRKYCREYSEREAKRAREAAMEHLENLYVTKEDFEGSPATDDRPEKKGYRSMSKKELKRRVKEGEISKAAYRQILACKESITTKPYNADLILTGSKKEHHDEGLKDNDHYEAAGMISKPIVCVLWAVVSKAADIAQQEITNWLIVAASIVMTVFGICLAAYTGYRFGWKCIDREEDRIKARTSFIYRFLEKHKEGTA
ncbi:MAG: hypothetical protein IJX39_08690 [Clostridia bacterium]|nr:hypothetical protein [Clostridia bacterium]